MSNVLIVDDDATHRHAISTIVSQLGHQAHVASDGNEGIAKLATVRPKLIFLDVVMTGKNGLETLRAIRAMPEWAQVAIVMVSSKSSPIDKKYAEMNKATSYITKPYKDQDIKDVLAKYA